MTSTGSGNAPSRPTSFDLSTMQTNFREAPATIFSRVKAPPPPLDEMQVVRRLVGAVDVKVDVADRGKLRHVKTEPAQPFRGAL